MESENTILDEIKRYDKGLMSAKKRKAFEERYHSDDLLREEIESYALLKAVLAHEKEEEKDLNSGALNPNHRRTRRIILPAAAVVLLIISSFFINEWLSPKSTNELYVQYFSSIDLPTDVRSSQHDEQWNLGKSYIKNKNYKAALGVFEKFTNDTIISKQRNDINYSQQYSIISKNPKDYMINEAFFYQAYCYVKLNAFQKGLNALNKISKRNYLYDTKAKWFRVGIYLKIGNPEQALNIVNGSLSDSFYKKEEALELQKALQRLQ